MYDRRGGSGFGTFLLGGLLGAVIALLFAPRSGKETRELIAERADEYWGQGVEIYETGKEKAVIAIETGKEKASDLIETGKAKAGAALDTGKEKVSASSEQIKSKIDEARERLQRQVDSTEAAAKSAMDEAADVVEGVNPPTTLPEI